MFNSTSVGFSQQSLSSGDWARLEQEYKDDDSTTTTTADLYAMLASAYAGISAYSVVNSGCEYATIVDDVVTVELKFFVWPNRLDLEYSLSSDIGKISEQTVLEFERSFDVIINGTNSVVLPYLFDGTLTPEMPFINMDGAEISEQDPTIDGSVVSFSEKLYCVLRAEGIVKGHMYTMTMTLEKVSKEQDGLYSVVYSSGTTGRYDGILSHAADKELPDSWIIEFISDTEFDLVDSEGTALDSGDINTTFGTEFFTMPYDGWSGVFHAGNVLTFHTTEIDPIVKTGYKIENLQNTITVTWKNDENEDVSDTITLDIPPCVEALLSLCDDGSSKGSIKCLDRDCDARPIYRAYFNTCNGALISGRWERNE